MCLQWCEAVSVVAEAAVACDRLNCAGGIHDSNSRVNPIGNINIPGGVRRDIYRQAELCITSWSAVSREALHPGSRKCSNYSIGVDFADAVIQPICDVEVACGINRDSRRKAEHGLRGRTIITAKADRKLSTRDDRGISQWINFPNRPQTIGDIKVSGRVHRQTWENREQKEEPAGMDLNGCDCASAVHLADRTISAVCDEQVPRTI